MIAIIGMVVLVGCNNNSPAGKFKQMAERTNKTCPIRMNETVTLDSTSYVEKSNVLSYSYSVTGELDNPAYMSGHYAAFKQMLQDAIDNSPEMQEYLDFGTLIKYIYYSKSSKKQLAEFSFDSNR